MRSRNGPGTRVEHVRRGDEHDPRQVERHAQVIVAESPVLLGVEHFEQGRGRVALDAAAELVDLVEHHHAVAAAGAADALDDVAGQRPDIGAPVAADLGFVMGAAEADADEFAPGGAGDALAERGLADAGRTDKAQDRAAAFGVELVDRQVFEDAPLDLGEPVMVGVEDAARLGDVDRLARFDRPRQFDQPFEIGARHRILAGRLRHALEPSQLAPGVVLDLGRHLGFGDLSRELGDLLALGVVAFAELLLDRLHLLAQQELALAVVDLFLGLLADLARQAQHLDAVDQHRRHPLEPA